MSNILRCVTGFIKRCASSGKILRCGEGCQWQTPYTNSGCGTCSNGYYPGVWTAGTPVLVCGNVNADDAGTVVIDADTGTALSYGLVYSTGAAPDTPDTSNPTVAPDQCACSSGGDRTFVYCNRSYGSSGGTCTTFVVQSVSTEQYDKVCEADGGCYTSVSAQFCEGSCINRAPAGSDSCMKLIHISCTSGEASAWIAANCPTYGACCDNSNCSS